MLYSLIHLIIFYNYQGFLGIQEKISYYYSVPPCLRVKKFGLIKFELYLNRNKAESLYVEEPHVGDPQFRYYRKGHETEGHEGLKLPVYT